MTLGNALNNAYSGLVVSSRRAEVTSHNVANATTPGFVKRQAEVSSVVVGTAGAGARLTSVELLESPTLTAERRLADAEAAGKELEAENAANLARLIGEPEDPGAMTERYSAFESSLRMLADEPGATHLQIDAINKAKDLVAGFSSMQESLLDIRRQADREIGLLVNQVNDTLGEIHQVNQDIRKEVAIDGDPTELIAIRKSLIDSIAEIIPVETHQTANGGLNVTTDSGYTLVSEGRIWELGFTAAPTVTPEMDLIAGAPGPLSGLTLQTQDVTPPTSSILSSGKLAALFEVRDVMTVEFQDQIDALSQDLINRFEDVDAASFGLFADSLGTRTADLYELDLNLPSGDTAVAGTIHSQTVDYFDAAGAQQTLTVEFETTGNANEWTMRVSDSGVMVGNPVSEMTLLFDAVGANAGYLNTVTDVSGPVFGAATAGAVAVPLGGGPGVATLELGVPGAAGPLSQTTAAFGPANAETAPKGLAGRLQINSAVDPDAGGEPAKLRDSLAATASTESGYNVHAKSLLSALTSANSAPTAAGVIGDFSAFDLVAGVSSLVSTQMLSAEQSSALRATRRETLTTAETAALGVDLDFELQELNLIQTAYSANAQVLRTVDEMLRTLLEI